MQKLFIPLLAIVMYFSTQAHVTALLIDAGSWQQHQNDDFEKSKDQTWPGKGDIWYKIDQNTELWWSKDGKKWEVSKDGLWYDADGKWIRIRDKKLWWSSDEGKTWAELPEWQWQGSDGKRYRFDKIWSLWVK